MRLGRLHPDGCIDAWWKCLRCFRFFTKRAEDLICPDCCKEVS